MKQKQKIMNRIKLLMITILFLTNLNVIKAQIQTGVWRSTNDNTYYHHFTRDGVGAAVYINQVSTENHHAILKLSRGTTTPNSGVKFSVENNGNVRMGTYNYIGEANSGYGYFGMSLRYINDQWESFHPTINGNAMKFVYNGIDFITVPPNTKTATASTLMRIKSDGDICIGTTTPHALTNGGTAKLSVNGGIAAKEIEVTIQNWSDYVFFDDYKLMPLYEIEKYIKENKHLPDVPSETEVLENGLNLGDMDAVLLQKIEELTLYTIEQQKMIDELKEEVKSIKNNN